MIDIKNLPKVALEEMNEVHYEEVHLLNKLEDTIQKSPNDLDGIAEILHELIEHTREHFSNEENLMRQYGFPAFMMHQGEHVRVLNEMQRFMQTWLNTKNNETIKEYYLGSLIEWLDTHIKTMDTITANFISMHRGVKS